MSKSYENPVDAYNNNRVMMMDTLQQRAQMQLYPRQQTPEANAAMQRHEDLAPLRVYDASPKTREQLMAVANLMLAAAPLLKGSAPTRGVGWAEPVEATAFRRWRGNFKSRGDMAVEQEQLRNMYPHSLYDVDRAKSGAKFLSEAERWEILRAKLGTPRLALPAEFAEAGTQVLGPKVTIPFKPGGSMPLK